MDNSTLTQTPVFDTSHGNKNRIIWLAVVGVVSLFMVPFLISFSFGGPSPNTNIGTSASHLLNAMEPSLPKLQYMGNHINPYYKVSSCSSNQFNSTNGCAPIGLASYGIYSTTNPATYTINTSILLGMINIDSLNSYNSQDGLVPQNSSSLQLNGVLIVHDKDGVTKEYWIQHGLEFIGNTGTFTSLGSITNLTGNMSSSMIINNSGSYCDQESSYVVCTSGGTAVRMPLSINMYMADFVVPDKGILIYTGTTNQNAHITPYTAYSKVSGNDSFMINDTDVSSAYFIISGNDYIKSKGTLVASDAEFVFGGVGSGTETTFENMNATLSLDYYNISSNSYMAFPSYYNFGFDTAETVGNINANYSGNGVVSLSPGHQKYVYLGK